MHCWSYSSFDLSRWANAMELWTDRQMDRQTNGWTDVLSYRDKRTQQIMQMQFCSKMRKKNERNDVLTSAGVVSSMNICSKGKKRTRPVGPTMRPHDDEMIL